VNSSDAPDVLCVFTTTASEEEARAISQRLVSARLAGCVQVIGPIHSTYRWEGKMEQAQEWLCLAKTDAEHYPSVEEAIREVHSYDVPEIVAVPAAHVDARYRNWLTATLNE